MKEHMFKAKVEERKMEKSSGSKNRRVRGEGSIFMLPRRTSFWHLCWVIWLRKSVWRFLVANVKTPESDLCPQHIFRSPTLTQNFNRKRWNVYRTWLQYLMKWFQFLLQTKASIPMVKHIKHPCNIWNNIMKIKDKQQKCDSHNNNQSVQGKIFPKWLGEGSQRSQHLLLYYSSAIFLQFSPIWTQFFFDPIVLSSLLCFLFDRRLGLDQHV